jgi:hypothetical protein
VCFPDLDLRDEDPKSGRDEDAEDVLVLDRRVSSTAFCNRLPRCLLFLRPDALVVESVPLVAASPLSVRVEPLTVLPCDFLAEARIRERMF